MPRKVAEVGERTKWKTAYSLARLLLMHRRRSASFVRHFWFFCLSSIARVKSRNFFGEEQSGFFFFFGIISVVIWWLLKRRKPEREIEAAIPQEEKSKTDDILTELR